MVRAKRKSMVYCYVIMTSLWLDSPFLSDHAIVDPCRNCWKIPANGTQSIELSSPLCKTYSTRLHPCQPPNISLYRRGVEDIITVQLL